MEPSITTTRSRRLRRTSLALASSSRVLSRSQSLAKQTEEEKAAKEAAAQEKLLQVFVSEPYLELSTGPGRGYPVFHVVEREALRRRALSSHRLVQGAHRTAASKAGHARSDMRRTKLADGSPFIFNLGDRAGYTTHDWELGIGGGDYGGANLISAYGAYSLTDNMKVEFTLSQFLGNASNGWKAELGLQHVLFPEWRLSPFLTLGTGIVDIEPRATIVLPVDRDRSDGVRRRGRCAFISPGAFSFAPTIAGTRSSRAAMTMRSWKNGKFKSPASSDRRAVRDGHARAAARRCAGRGTRKRSKQPQTEEQAAAEEEAEDADSTPPRVIEPNVARRKIKTPKIDNENWELGAGFGFMSIEDFGTNSTYAAQLNYHVTEDFFFRGRSGAIHGRPDQLRDPRRQHRAADRR